MSEDASVRPSSRQRTGTPEHPSDAVLTIPNVLTVLRIALLPVFMWLALDRHRIGVAFALGLVIGFSDLFDGMLARRLRQVSRLGITLDPLFDRLAVAATVIILIGLHLAPWQALAIAVGRDAILVVGGVVMRRRIDLPPVSRLGKWGSFWTMWGLGLFLASGIDPRIRHPYRVLAWTCFIPGVAFSYLAAIEYVRTSIRALRSKRSHG